MRTRVIVCPLIRNASDEYLICKTPKNRGIYPGQWCCPGGGIEPDEKMMEALHREIAEELGSALRISEITPWTFSDDIREKIHADGTREWVYMIYLIFDCLAENTDIEPNEEFVEFAWVPAENLKNYDLNAATRLTFEQKGFLMVEQK
ncbi:MAG: nucleoside triphosphatase NudI [Verrucomicrobia bacterium]|nr:nucleoside triphosphatase NudI [Verrucomicrobiota bacterium]